ncbi:shiftless antiviral inhibitor of ribosomal frameshifting protein-like [Babylonia areolata]|uniref:shiftless antiviral inhibitor of ribosomal frameshifting protein-like n=1 Tax=Babylonia areolata TaxID=304850 RepID=UPI003FD30FBF
MAYSYSYQKAEEEKEARKLRELFKGRFSDDESLEVLKEQGGLSDAVDFILNSDPVEVRRLINDRNEALVEALRKDSAYIQETLTQGLEATIRLFSCQGCDNYWWRKVPVRKEVSTCKICKTKYDPVPRDQEWGLAEYSCVCGNVFWGSGWMNHTQSPCYNCLCLTCPTRIVPPTRPRQQKRRAEHSCTGTNCYNRSAPSGSNGPLTDGGAPTGAEGGYQLCAYHREICAHERSWRQRKVLYPSTPHVSTGSTVKTFLTQGTLDEFYGGDEHESLPDVPEVDDEY